MFNNDYARFYDIFNVGKPYKKEVEFVYFWANRPETILDIGCGTGIYWKYYPKETYLVGIERSLPMVKLDRGVVICTDVRDFNMNIFQPFDCVTALFDVINYIPKHDWWAKLPLKRGGFFIFDIWDTKKIAKDGFKKTIKIENNFVRLITPINQNRNYVDLKINVSGKGIIGFEEVHRMYLHTAKDIERFCGKEFEIVEVEPTERWQTWVKCRRK